MTISNNMSDMKTPKNAEKYMCENCDFKCSKKSDYDRHLMTTKHKMMTNDDNTDDKNTKNATSYMCVCGKSYKHRQGLSLHKKKCVQNTPESTESASPSPPENIVHESISEATLMKCFHMMGEQSAARDAARDAAQASAQASAQAAQAEQTRLLIEAISLNGMQCITNNNNNTTNNTNNNQFNLNVFLNEDCKDAYTLKEVAESIECTVSDLDRMDKDGYAATITRKILESIENMSITERPIHCTDARRNAVCVKEETGWEKNETALKSLNSTIFLIGNKIHGMMDDWRAKYPEHRHGSESRRKQYHRLVMEVIKVSDRVTESHIVSKVCNGVILDRKAAMDR